MLTVVDYKNEMLKRKGIMLTDYKDVQKQLFKINRFPICMLFYYGLAKNKYNYSDKQAMALGYAVALFFAIMKNKKGYFLNTVNDNNKNKNNKRKYKTKYEREVEKIKDNELKEITIDRLTFDGVLNEKENYIMPIVANRIIKADDFVKELNKKLNKNEAIALMKYAVDYFNDKGKIRNAFKLYTSIRDVWRKHDFINYLLDLYNLNNDNDVIN